jgi:site-specific DNA recombinase
VGDLAWFARTSFEKSKKKPVEDISLFSNHHHALDDARACAEIT